MVSGLVEIDRIFFPWGKGALIWKNQKGVSYKSEM